jgi:hypothetical protein
MLLHLDYLQYRPALRLTPAEPEGWQVFDPLRRKNVALTPEELLRQLVVRYLLEHKGYPPNRMRVEACHRLNGQLRRCDVLVFDRALQPWLLVECKSPKVALTESTFEQAAHYNLHWKAPYLAITNGLVTCCCSIDHESKTFAFLEDFPECR